MSQRQRAFQEMDSNIEQPDVPLHLSDRHLLILEDSLGRRKIELDKFVYAIGRDPKCDICLWSEFASRHHATLVQLSGVGLDAGYYRIVDGDLNKKHSRNGIFVNGRRVKAHDLENEDQIIFGFQTRAIYYHLKQDDGMDSVDPIEQTIIAKRPEIKPSE